MVQPQRQPGGRPRGAEPDRPPLQDALENILARLGEQGVYASEEKEQFVLEADRLLEDPLFWRKMGEEYQQPLIITGKLGSAAMQMVVYLSAVSPCLAFTYMLRGIAFPTILVLLFYVVLGSLGLSVISLLIGTLTTEKHWQVVLSVLLIIGLVVAFNEFVQHARGLGVHHQHAAEVTELLESAVHRAVIRLPAL